MQFHLIAHEAGNQANWNKRNKCSGLEKKLLIYSIYKKDSLQSLAKY